MLREPHAIAVAFRPREHVHTVPGIVGGQRAVQPGRDLFHPERPFEFSLLHQAGIFAVEHPALSDGYDRLSVLPDGAEEPDSVLEGLERRALPLARDHLGRDTGGDGLAIADRVLTLTLVQLRCQPFADSPRPIAPQPGLERLRLPAERQAGHAHPGRHDRHEIVVGQMRRHEIDEGSVDRVRALDVDVRCVEEEKEDPGARIGQRPHHLALRARLGSGGLRADGGHDVLEGLDLLRHAILEHFEVGGLQAIHDPPSLGGWTSARKKFVPLGSAAGLGEKQGGQRDRHSQHERARGGRPLGPHGYRTTRIALRILRVVPPTTTSSSTA